MKHLPRKRTDGHERKILKSWKEIAFYLGVGTRTAQRWMHEQGLPVKQPGSRRSAVLGLTDEIDQWVLDSSNTLTKRSVDQPQLADILATDMLWHRHSRPRQFEREVHALLELGQLMAHQDQKTILSKVAAYALTLCKAESSGFSVLETDESGREIFRWKATCGRMQSFEGGTTPAEFSPCALSLERDSPQLFKYPEKFYSYLQPIAPIAELLLIPIHDGNAWLGTIWVMCHQHRRQFDREDARLMADLGSLASAAFSTTRMKRLKKNGEAGNRKLRRRENP